MPRRPTCSSRSTATARRATRRSSQSSTGGSFKVVNDGPGSTDEGGGIGGKIASVPGNALGGGSTKGVKTTTDLMVDMAARLNATQVNICGHSRGAITSVRIAAKLYEASPMLPVFLFLIDPVKRMAMGTDFYNREIHPNVRDVRVVVMEGVGDKVLFKVLSLKTRASGAVSRHDLTADEFTRMPGALGTATQVDAPIGQVTFQFARQFLARNGAPVGAGAWDNLQLCDHYFLIPLRNPIVTRGMVTTRVVNDGGANLNVSKASRADRLDGLGITNRFRDHPIFVNEHHYDLFRSGFPSLAAYFSGSGGALGDAAINGEIARLRGVLPNGYALLTGLGII